jgi:hypothetical protein
VIEHGNLRVLFVVKFTVYVDFHMEKGPAIQRREGRKV